MAHIVDPSARISRLADLEDSQRGSRLVIGADVVIESFVKVKFAGGSGDVVIGPRCTINAGVAIYSGHGVRLGTGVLIAANCTLAATNHAIGDPAVLIRDQGFMASRGGIIIEDDVWLGANCVVLDGAHIGRGAVIGAGSVVRGHVPELMRAVGSPLRFLGLRGKTPTPPASPTAPRR